jgi:hypothetical protein
MFELYLALIVTLFGTMTELKTGQRPGSMSRFGRYVGC